jgi:hypothetical protein
MYTQLNGLVPSQWLTSLVTPIPKVHNPRLLSGLRPISVTPILSRVVEKFIFKTGLRPAVPLSVAAH